MNKRLSIIVPIYNVDKYLERCIQSILNQKYSNFELILINDGSTDNSINICNKYVANNKNIILIDKLNEGVSIARNVGLEKASGEYVTFVDADDYVDESIYEIAFNNIEQDNLDIVEFGLYHESNGIINKEVRINRTEVLDGIETINRLLKDKAFNTLWNKVFKRELFLNLRFPKDKIYEDGYIIWRVLLKAERYKAIDSVLYYHTIRNDSIMGTQKKYSLRNLDGLESQQERYAYLKKNISNKEILDLALAKLYIENIYHYRMLSINSELDKSHNIRKSIISEMKKERYKILKNKYIGLSKIILFIGFINNNLFDNIINIYFGRIKGEF